MLRTLEGSATFGLLLLAVGLVAPFTNFGNTMLGTVFKWVFAVGALIYTVARVIGSLDKGDSLRIRRLRRMEMWAGLCFCAGAFFWFYNASRNPGILTLAVMRDTVAFTLAGAVIQIIASWMIAARKKKES